MTPTEIYWAEVYAAHAANLVKRFGADRVADALVLAHDRPHNGERRDYARKLLNATVKLVAY